MQVVTSNRKYKVKEKGKLLSFIKDLHYSNHDKLPYQNIYQLQHDITQICIATNFNPKR